ncbi:MAG TPA: hypothetical protein VLA09_00480 [Longimicrobiales bacterium]|nr:hypothetical protein [Longimicrobiales bacterium]
MTLRTVAALGPIVVVTLLLAPALGDAQEPLQDPAPGPQPEPELVFEREVFRYPAFSRRNPFVPLEGAQGGIRYEQLSLIGIMYSSDPSASVAVVSTGGYSIAEDGTLTPIEGDAYNVKVGQRIGNTTVREIQRDRVIVDVEEFGLTDRRTMFIASRRQGGTQ